MSPAAFAQLLAGREIFRGEPVEVMVVIRESHRLAHGIPDPLRIFPGFEGLGRATVTQSGKNEILGCASPAPVRESTINIEPEFRFAHRCFAFLYWCGASIRAPGEKRSTQHNGAYQGKLKLGS